jgi:hypothetical protein
MLSFRPIYPPLGVRKANEIDLMFDSGLADAASRRKDS